MEQSRSDFESKIIERVASDPALREELLRSPNEVLSREFGTKIPGGAEIRVVEETPKLLYIVLPPQTSATGELTDEELECGMVGREPIGIVFASKLRRLWQV